MSTQLLQVEARLRRPFALTPAASNSWTVRVPSTRPRGGGGGFPKVQLTLASNSSTVRAAQSGAWDSEDRSWRAAHLKRTGCPSQAYGLPMTRRTDASGILAAADGDLESTRGREEGGGGGRVRVTGRARRWRGLWQRMGTSKGGGGEGGGWTSTCDSCRRWKWARRRRRRRPRAASCVFLGEREWVWSSAPTPAPHPQTPPPSPFPPGGRTFVSYCTDTRLNWADTSWRPEMLFSSRNAKLNWSLAWANTRWITVSPEVFEVSPERIQL